MGAKRDRTARLIKVEHLLHQYPRGLGPHDLARHCAVSLRTAYRDLRALQDELELPIWQGEDGRYGLERSHFLPPVKLNLFEATALFLAARLASRYSDERDPSIAGAFAKLATILPPPVAQHVQDTVAALAARAHNRDYERVFEVLATAWASYRRVRIWYPRSGPGGAATEYVERLLDPYFLEPSASGHSCYVIGLDHLSGDLRTFKLERVQAVELTSEEFLMPSGWSASDYLRHSWGIVNDEAVEVRARFSPVVAGRVREAVWHPSQTLVEDDDGGLTFTVRVAGTMEITPWLLSWGPEVEVLAPPELRERFAQLALRLAETYAARSTEASQV